MAIEPLQTSASTSKASQSQPKQKRRRLSDSSQSRIFAAATRLSSLGHHDAVQPSYTDETVAYSPTEPLIAFPHTEEQLPVSNQSAVGIPKPFSIAVKPLLSTLPTSPLILRTPLLVDSAHSYRVTKLQFSPTGGSLVAVIASISTGDQNAAVPSGSASSPIGFVCIWSRPTEPTNGACDEYWQLSGSWPLSRDQGQLTSDIIGLYWLPPDGGRNIVRPPSEEAAKLASNPGAAQLPGMNQARQQAKKSQHRFEIARAPVSGPSLRQRGALLPEGLILVGADGRVHLLHRNVSIHHQLPSSAAAQVPFQILTATSLFPCVGAENLGQFQQDVKATPKRLCSLCPVAGENALLLATAPLDGGKCVSISEITVDTEQDEPTLEIRPLDILDMSQASEGSLDTDAPLQGQLCCLQFSQPYDTATSSTSKGPSTTSDEAAKDIVLLVGVSDSIQASTQLTSWLLGRRLDKRGKDSLSEAFASLESRKKAIDDVETEEGDGEWHIILREMRNYAGRTLLQVSRFAASFYPEREKNHLAIRWLRISADEDGKLGQEWSIVDPYHMSPETDTMAIASDAIHHRAISANGTLQAFWTDDMSGPRVHSFPFPARNTAIQSELASITLRIASSLHNGQSYLDILLANVHVLRTRQNRLWLLGLVSNGLGLRLTTSLSPKTEDISKFSDPASVLRGSNLGVVAQAVQLQAAMAQTVLKALAPESRAQQSVSRKHCHEELERARLLQDLLQTLKTLSTGCTLSVSGQMMEQRWCISALPTLKPVIVRFVEVIETVCQSAIVADTSAKATGKGNSASRPQTGALLALVASQSVTPLVAQLLSRSLRMILSLLNWLDTICADDAATERLVVAEATRLAHEVKYVKAARNHLAQTDGDFISSSKPTSETGSAAISTSPANPLAVSTPAAGLLAATPLLGGASALLTSQATPQQIGTPLQSILPQTVRLPQVSLPYADAGSSLTHQPTQDLPQTARHFSASLTRTLTTLREVLQERLRASCGVDLAVFHQKLDQWQQSLSNGTDVTNDISKEPNQDAEEGKSDAAQGWADHDTATTDISELLGWDVLSESYFDTPSKLPEKTQGKVDEFCRFLLDASKGDENTENAAGGSNGEDGTDQKPLASSKPLLRDGGLSLFLKSDDFVKSLSDVSPHASPDNASLWVDHSDSDVQRHDTFSGARLHGSSRSRLRSSQSDRPVLRRDLISGQATTVGAIPSNLGLVAAAAAAVLPNDMIGSNIVAGGSQLAGISTEPSGGLQQAEEQALRLVLSARANGYGDKVRAEWSRELGSNGSSQLRYWWSE